MVKFVRVTRAIACLARAFTRKYTTQYYYYIMYDFTLRDNDTRVRKKYGVNVHNTILAHEITIFFETKTDALIWVHAII